jgi:Ca2+-binding RTX toxin-like protein
MRRTVLLVASTVFAVLLSCGVALALNAISCEGEGKRCVGTDRPDLMKGTGDVDAIYGRDKGDTLKGFGDTDALLGQKGEDTLIAGPVQDFLIGGPNDDRLRGEEALDIYCFERPDWGRDTIREVSPFRNILFLPDGEDFSGPVITNLDSDEGPLPEVGYPGGASTVNWKDDAITFVIGSTGDDRITGSGATNRIFDGVDRETDAGTVSGAGETTSWTCRTTPPTTR